MAKGSGGVGKSKGKASVSGAVTKAVAAAAPKFGPADITAENLAAVAKTLPDSAKFGRNQYFLGPLLEKFGTTPQAQQQKLMSLYMSDKVTLSRADLVEAMSPKMVSSSEIARPGTNATYHLIEFN